MSMPVTQMGTGLGSGNYTYHPAGIYSVPCYSYIAGSIGAGYLITAGHVLSAHHGYSSGDLQNTGAPRTHSPTKLEFRGRVSGPVLGLLAIFDRWQIKDREAAILLGLQSTANLADLKAGTVGLGTRDLQDRARLIMNIYEGVHSLVRELDAEHSWISASMPALGGRSLLGVMKQGSIVDLMTAKAFVDYANGR